MPIITDLFKTTFGLYVLLPFGIFWWLLRSKTWFLRQFLLTFITLAATDITSHRLIKPAFQRTRPYQTIESAELRTHQHTGFSFPSNHAANNFAFAGVLTFLSPQTKWIWIGIASLIAYSRVYVGVHYPLDVLAGALLGWMIAFLMCRFLGPKLLPPPWKPLRR